ETPARVRVTILKEEGEPRWLPGMRVALFAELGPPGAPVEPGGFDFRRIAWFDRLGAIGIARGAVLRLEDGAAEGPWARAMIGVSALRATITNGLRRALPGETGGFAAAILVGDQSGLPVAARDALRASNLSHLLSISGLHMVLLTGFVYTVLRLALVLTLGVRAAWPVRKIAALAAMAAGLAYLALSGAAVPAQRSYIMVLVFFGAILIDRAALSLRSVALAAMAILVLMPESLMEVGFQLSFAATIALVAAYDALARAGWNTGARGPFMQAAMMALTSLVAGSATAPFAAHAFHQSASYGLVANMLAVPLMGVWIMPAGVIAALLAPFGLEGLAVAAMGLGIDLVMAIAHWVAGFPGALRRIAAPEAPVIVPIALGGLWLCLWRSRLRLAGIGAMLAGMAWWAGSVDRPDLIVAASGRQIGLMGPTGRVILDAKREGFAAREWLAADGDGVEPAEAALREGLMRGRDWASGRLGPWRIEIVTAREPDLARLARLCGERVLLILPSFEAAPEGLCLAVTAGRLREAGALAFRLRGEALVAAEVLRPGPGRLWTAPGRGEAQ
ncbi:MAG TPA: ComEC/Rec2 family competence protein, partial [Paracoccaceae bacterium]|nr:ComEC/Rec2 family competence protein [Paracoccaceae bacterium]